MGQSPFELHFKRFCSKFPFQKPSHFCWAYHPPPSVMTTKKVWNLTHPQIPPLSLSTKTHITQHWKKKLEKNMEKKKTHLFPSSPCHHHPAPGLFLLGCAAEPLSPQAMAICEPHEAICEAEEARPVMEEPQSVGSSKMSGQWLINCLAVGLSQLVSVGFKKAHEHHEPYISQLNEISCIKHKPTLLAT